MKIYAGRRSGYVGGGNYRSIFYSRRGRKSRFNAFRFARNCFLWLFALIFSVCEGTMAMDTYPVVSSPGLDFYSVIAKVLKIPPNFIISQTIINSSIDMPNNKHWFIDPITTAGVPAYKDADKMVDFYCNIAKRCITRYVQLRNVMVSFKSAFAFDHLLLEFEFGSQFRESGDGKIVGYYDDVIVLGHEGTIKNYGHMFQDFFHPLLMLPEALISKCKIYANVLRASGVETLLLLGFKKEQIIFMNDGEWIFVRHAHTIINNSAFLSHYASGAVMLREKFNKYYNLDAIPATRYCLCNRDDTGYRHLSNFDELVELVKKEFPNFNWEVVPDYEESIKKAAIEWASYLLIFCPTGSNQAKIYFMKPNAVMVSACCEVFDYSLGSLAFICNVFILQFHVPNWSHWKIGGGPLNILEAIRCIEIGLYVSKFERWPSYILK